MPTLLTSVSDTARSVYEACLTLRGARWTPRSKPSRHTALLSALSRRSVSSPHQNPALNAEWCRWAQQVDNAQQALAAHGAANAPPGQQPAAGPTPAPHARNPPDTNPGRSRVHTRAVSAKLPLPCPYVPAELTTVGPMQIISQACIRNDMFAGPTPRLASSMRAAPDACFAGIAGRFNRLHYT